MSEKGRSADPLGAPQADPGLWEQMTEALRQRDAARSELAALHERITALADQWDGEGIHSDDPPLAVCDHEAQHIIGRLRALLRPDENGDNT